MTFECGHVHFHEKSLFQNPAPLSSGGQAGTGSLLCNKSSLLWLMFKSMKLLRIGPALAMELKPGGYQEYQERPSGTFRHRILCYMWSSSLTSRSWVLEVEQSWPLCPASFPPHGPPVECSWQCFVPYSRRVQPLCFVIQLVLRRRNTQSVVSNAAKGVILWYGVVSG